MFRYCSYERQYVTVGFAIDNTFTVIHSIRFTTPRLHTIENKSNPKAATCTRQCRKISMFPNNNRAPYYCYYYNIFTVLCRSRKRVVAIPTRSEVCFKTKFSIRFSNAFRMPLHLDTARTLFYLCFI